ncbi:polysaccharide pyruvyl transferase family protein [Vibrio sp. SCSIO 43133]|uniref:polysaccharide pyruvyl transferase family protein n=1 Tax=Vibrio sp. SCSIO 43133 TaxID=2802577 RepID=UPI0020762967|nr:polysaccharide pyruvyl transferase family protein [Vibrio sp. SCSIO 43133]USE00337.1 polysaccharide pyruvyl transferase family protein [Vibrio sp. SCSIO 43133]
MSKKIGLVGLYSIKNMGDPLICETTRHILDENNNNLDIVEVDAVPRKKESYKGIDGLKYMVSVFLIRYLYPKLFKLFNGTRFRYHAENIAWRLRLASYYERVLEDLDAIVFTGGGFLKFKNQGLNYYVEQIVEICERKDIPVMFCGVGIEGFDLNDTRCVKLKASLASKCIKSVTTRDFIEILENDYLKDLTVHRAQVGDPAFWVPECYGIEKKINKEPVIGINVIRGNIYRDYGNNLTFDELKEIYKKLILKLDGKGVRWILFSNGMKADQVFGRQILTELGMPIKDNLLPVPKSPRELVEMVSNFDIIFGARMHACISAYALDIPVVGLIWNEKTTRLAELTKQREMYFKENEIDIDLMVSKLINSKDFAYNVEARNALKCSTKRELQNFIQQI